MCYGFNTKHKLSDATADKSGLVCIWNIKNLEFPERIFYLPSTATSCDFSLANPNLLAVGLFTGTVVIFNVTRKRKGFLKIWSHENYSLKKQILVKEGWVRKNLSKTQLVVVSRSSENTVDSVPY